MPEKMNGHSILTDEFVICVDKWDASYLRRPGSPPHYFFLTHLHADHIKGLTSTWSRIIYTSPFNAWLLPKRRGVKAILLKDLELNVTHTIQKSSGGVAFRVTLLDANHCPGAVMFLFQGSFGNILYTGDFRYSADILESPVLLPLIRKKEISTLYLDNTYAAVNCIFPSREDALEEVLDIIDKHPDHKILIGLRQLGKEEVLRAIALHLNERVCVSPQRLEILEKLQYEDVFTVDVTQSRIHAKELHTLTQSVCRDTGKVISIKLTSMYECGKFEKRRENDYVVAYTDHSSHTELKQFVEKIRPQCIVPIVLPKLNVGSSEQSWTKMASVYCIIPEVIWNLCGQPSKLIPSPDNSPKKLPLSIKYHPPPKETNQEVLSRNVNHIDDGFNIVPFDSSGPHFTIKNNARKHIKASWTRLAPKILSSKGISFNKGSLGSNEEPVTEDTQLNPVSSEHNSVNVEIKLADDARRLPSFSDVIKVRSDDEDSIHEVPDSEDDDMPSSAGDLRRRMQFSTKAIMMNGSDINNRLNHFPGKFQKSSKNHSIERQLDFVGHEDVNQQRDEQAKGKSSTSVGDDDIGETSPRLTRKSSAVNIENPKKGHKGGSETESPESRHSHKVAKATQILTRRSLREAYGKEASMDSLSENVLRRSESKESLSMFSSSKKSDSVESLIRRTNSRECVTSQVETRRSSPRMENKSQTKKTENKESWGKAVKNQLKEVLKELLPKECSVTLPCRSDSVKIVKEASVLTSQPNSSGTVENLCNRHVAVSPTDCQSTSKVPFSNQGLQKCVTEKPNVTNVSHNGVVSSINGIHINSPGRRRVNCDWEVAQEIVRQETEQALKALESLNMMKGSKLRKPISQVDPRDRRFSADSNIQMSKIVDGSASSSKPNVQSKTAQIINSMASMFKAESVRSGEICSERNLDSEAVLPTTQFPTPSSPLKTSQATKKGESVQNNETQQIQISSNPDNNKIASPKKGTLVASISGASQKLSVGGLQVSSSKQAPKLPCPKSNVSAISLRSKPPPVNSPNVEHHKEQDILIGQPKEITIRHARPINIIENLPNNNSVSSQSLFLSDSNLAPAELTSITKDWMRIPRKSTEKEDSLNVGLMRLKVDFAMSSSKKGPRASLPTRISSVKHSPLGSPHGNAPLQSKEKVQAWKNKISMTLTKSPHRRFRMRALNKPRQSGRLSLSRLPKRNLAPPPSQNYHADVEDCDIDLTQELPAEVELFEGNSDYFADVESVYDKTQDITSSHSMNLDGPPENRSSESGKSVVNVKKSSEISAGVQSPEEKLPSSSLVDELTKVDRKIREKTRRSLRLHKDASSKEDLEKDMTSISDKVSTENSPGKDRVNTQKSGKTQSVSLKDSTENNDATNKVVSKSTGRHTNPSESHASPINPEGTNPGTSTGGCRKEKATQAKPEENFRKPSEVTYLRNTRGTTKHTDQTTNPASSNILSLMADAFKKTVPNEKSSSTVSILSSMANNFNNLGEERTPVSSSLSIQLMSPHTSDTSPRETEGHDWSIEIVPVPDTEEREDARLKWNSKAESRLSLRKLTGVKTPESLSIELLPGQGSPTRKPTGRKEPSPPSVSISMDNSPEVIDLTGGAKSGKRGDRRSLSSQKSSYSSSKTRSRQPKPSEVEPTPQSVWRERQGGSANVININIETEERAPQIAHCPNHCSCGAVCRQNPCMGTSNNIHERESDVFFEVPLSPEDFESSGAMVALEKTWLESCFENSVDREEFLKSHEGHLQFLKNRNKSSSKHTPSLTSTPIHGQGHVRQVLQSTSVRSSPSSSGIKSHRCEPDVTSQLLSIKDAKPQKRSSTDSERSESLLREIEKKIRAYNDEQERKQTEGRSSLRKRESLDSMPNHSAGKSDHAPKAGSAKKCDVKAPKRPLGNTSSPDSSEGSEVKKARLSELEKLIEAGKSPSNKRYRLSVRRSLDHLITRQKLRSDKRVKKTIAKNM